MPVTESEVMRSSVSDDEVKWQAASKLTKLATHWTRLQFLFRNATLNYGCLTKTDQLPRCQRLRYKNEVGAAPCT